MAGSAFHLAQLNIALPKAPFDSPLLDEFMAQLDPVNAIADDSPGFVWRLQTEDGDATAIRPFDDDRIIVNMSVWGSLDDLGTFVYATGHLDVLRRRREWFERMPESHQALWWVPAGTLPDVAEATRRLGHLREYGPSPHAFTFREPYPAPDANEPITPEDRWFCPA
jgi:hypothetical protein